MHAAAGSKTTEHSNHIYWPLITVTGSPQCQMVLQGIPFVLLCFSLDLGYSFLLFSYPFSLEWAYSVPFYESNLKIHFG